MKTLVSLFLAMAVGGFSTQCLAAWADEAKIKRLHFDRDLGDKVFIDLEINTASLDCHSNTAWDYVLPLVTELDHALLGSLNEAMAERIPVKTLGKGNCNDHGNVETIRAAWLDKHEGIVQSQYRSAGNGKVTQVQPYQRDRAYLRTESQAAPNSGFQPTSGCDVNQLGWAIDLTSPSGQAMYSTVLTAFSLGKSVKVHGRGVCDLGAKWQSLYSVTVDG